MNVFSRKNIVPLYHSMRLSITLAFLLAAFVVTAVFGSIIIAFYHANNLSLIKQSTSTTAGVAADSVSNVLLRYETRIESAARSSQLDSFNGQGTGRSPIYTSLSSTYGFDQVFYAAPNGMLDNSVDISKQAYFQQALKGKTSFSTTVSNPLDGRLSVLVATPVGASDRIRGVLVGVIYSDTFNNIVSDIRIGEDGYVFLVDDTGKILAHRDILKVQRGSGFSTSSQAGSVDAYSSATTEAGTQAAKSLATNMKAGGSDSVITTLDGTEQCISYAPVDAAPGWSVGASASVGELMANFNRSIWIVVIVFLVLMLMLIVVTTIFTDSMITPFVRLIKRFQLLAEGDLHTEIPKAKGKNEMAVLTRTISDTVQVLNDYISEISGAMTAIADGDLTWQIHREYKGDFLSIRESITRAITSFNGVFTEFVNAAEQVSSGSEQVSAGAQALSQGATEQASAIEELAASIGEVASEVRSTAENAEAVNAFAEKAKDEIEKGRQGMDRLMQAINDIDSASGQISKIIKTIEDIAFQTNILALNAAVEAARAGSAGRGFGVVGGEVRTHAARRAPAAQNTADLIQNSLDAVHKGSSVAQDTAQSFTTVIEGVLQTNQLIQEITNSTANESASINQISGGLDQISAVVQTNSAAAQQSAATSEELSSHAQMLKNTLGLFRLSPVASADAFAQADPDVGVFAQAAATDDKY